MFSMIRSYIAYDKSVTDNVVSPDPHALKLAVKIVSTLRIASHNIPATKIRA